MKNAKFSAITLSLISIFSTAAYAENEQQTVSRVALSDDNHTQMAAENVRKINTEMLSGNLNNVDLSSFNIEQSYDLNNHAVLLAENTVTETATDTQPPAREVLSGSLKNNQNQPTELETIVVEATKTPVGNMKYAGSVGVLTP
ncbi:MAG: hypothetical protein IKH45_01780, partial [Neisseriaceae bacterium]|nr:hypothetical protein [Neisseriaceae bacterium]